MCTWVPRIAGQNGCEFEIRDARQDVHAFRGCQILLREDIRVYVEEIRVIFHGGRAFGKTPNKVGDRFELERGIRLSDFTWLNSLRVANRLHFAEKRGASKYLFRLSDSSSNEYPRLLVYTFVVRKSMANRFLYAR